MDYIEYGFPGVEEDEFGEMETDELGRTYKIARQSKRTTKGAKRRQERRAKRWVRRHARKKAYWEKKLRRNKSRRQTKGRIRRAARYRKNIRKYDSKGKQWKFRLAKLQGKSTRRLRAGKASRKRIIGRGAGRVRVHRQSDIAEAARRIGRKVPKLTAFKTLARKRVLPRQRRAAFKKLPLRRRAAMWRQFYLNLPPLARTWGFGRSKGQLTFKARPPFYMIKTPKGMYNALLKRWANPARRAVPLIGRRPTPYVPVISKGIRATTIPIPTAPVVPLYPPVAPVVSLAPPPPSTWSPLFPSQNVSSEPVPGMATEAYRPPPSSMSFQAQQAVDRGC